MWTADDRCKHASHGCFYSMVLGSRSQRKNGAPEHTLAHNFLVFTGAGIDGSSRFLHAHHNFYNSVSVDAESTSAGEAPTISCVCGHQTIVGCGLGAALFVCEYGKTKDK